MPDRTLNESSEQPQRTRTNLKSPNDDGRTTSILVFISAHAIGSLGLAMSIFAIWLGWLIPANVTPQTIEEHVIKKPRAAARRPPAITVSPVPLRRASEPLHITPILNSHVENNSTTPRHVYFEDSTLPPITRRNTMPEPHQSTKHLEKGPVINASAKLFSVSPLTNIMDLPAQDNHEYANPPDSDSSPHSSKPSSLKSSSCLQKLKLFGHSKNSSSHRADYVDKLSDQGSIASTDTNGSEKSARRASGGLTAAWNLSRHRGTLVETTEPSTASPSRLSFGRRISPSRSMTRPASATPNATAVNSSDILSPTTFLTRKSQKRISAPIPRTTPYGAPYFAAPPVLLDNNYHAYLKALPQFEDEMKTATPLAVQNDEPERERGRPSSIRRVNLNVLLPKARSASVDGTTRRRDAAS